MFIVVWFGKFPNWIDKWKEDMERLKEYGYDYILFNDLIEFEKRVRTVLKIEPFIVSGTGKPWDFRPAFGLLFAEQLKGYDFWGHTDLDCVYGRLDRWMSDEFLSTTDIFGNDPQDICGMFSLYRNTEKVNNLFRKHPHWEYIMSDWNVHAFDEEAFSKEVVRKENELRVKYGFFQGNDKQTHKLERLEDGSLLIDGCDTMVYHFRESKKYPL